MSDVALVRCESYDYGAVRAAVQRGIDLVGGAGYIAGKDEKILLKANLLVGDARKNASTPTRPS